MHGVVFEDLGAEVMAELPSEGRREVLVLLEQVRADPYGWPDAADWSSVEEIREAYGSRCWVHYQQHAGAVEVRGIGWVA
ncbi:hypothetical protein [Streptomyces sp. NBC_01262]|uniref:hypothetical protein n=1 Tax=Streptomyces sp. NBC_01262 TaxID=2903803 RepID=UPI002E33C590|nr:hypothetical protein [Streptomyces sp. NBC_01262]